MITFTQTGDILEGPQYITQFTRGAPVSVTLSDTTFKANEDITNPDYTYSLVWQNSLGKNVAISALSYDASTNTCTGTVGRAATICSGLTYVALAAIDVSADVTLTTVAATVDIKRSVDAELGLTEDAEPLSDAIANIVSEKAVSSAGYNGTSDLGKIPVVNTDGNLTVKRVHFLIDNEEDGETWALVLRGAVGQIIASIPIEELAEETCAPTKIENSYWSGYKYADGRMVLYKSVTITNKSLRKDDVSSVYKTLDILSQYYTYPASFVAAPIVSCRYTPASDRLHIGIYGSQDDNRAAAEDDGTYKTPPYFYLCSPVSSSQTLSGVADLVVEGRWK